MHTNTLFITTLGIFIAPHADILHEILIYAHVRKSHVSAYLD